MIIVVEVDLVSVDEVEHVRVLWWRVAVDECYQMQLDAI